MDDDSYEGPGSKRGKRTRKSTDTGNSRTRKTPNKKIDYKKKYDNFCEEILDILTKNKDSIYFLEPVDPIALMIPNYPDIIKNPMDYSTIRV